MNINRKMRVLLIFCFALFFVLSKGFAQDFTNLLDSVLDIENFPAEGQQEKNQTESGLKITGKHTLSGALPLKESSLNGETAPTLKNQVSLSFDQGRGFAFAAGLELKSTLEKVGEGSQLQHSFRPTEVYMGSYDPGGIWSLYLGWQNFSWGAADKIGPMDILNPLDLRLSPRQQKKLSVLGAQFQLQPLPWLGLEIVYLPFYQSNQIDTLAKLSRQLGSKVLLDKTDLDFNEPTLGGRLRFYLPNFDIGLSYLFAPDATLSPTPQLRLNTNTSIYLLDTLILKQSITDFITFESSIYLLDTLILKREQLHHWGLDLRLALAHGSLWLDTAFSLNTAWEPSSYTVRSPKLSSVLGADFSYGPEQKFYANFQYGLYWLPDYRVNYSGALKPGRMEEENNQNYYLYQFNKHLPGYQEGLLQRFILHLAFPFALSSRSSKASGKEPLNLNAELNLAYDLPLFYNGTKQHRIYLNPELEINWDSQTSASHSLQFGIALGLEWFAKLEQGAIKPGYYTDQLYLEFRLLW